MGVTITTTPHRRAVKYITRPKPEVHLWACEFCDTSIKLCVEPIEVLHRCLRTRMPRRLTERPAGWKREKAS